MNPIGGYFELECGHTPLYYPDGIYLNLCRNAIRYLVRALGIRKMHVPYYTCHTVSVALRMENCEIEFYEIDEYFQPRQDFPKNDFIIYNNYFGVMGANVAAMAARYPNLIVDNSQAFYSRPRGRAAVYSPRKFFGLPDGGIVLGKDIPRLNLEQATSYEGMSHLLKRIDLGPQAGYGDFVANDGQMESEPVKAMSKLTLALMGNIDYAVAVEKRKTNFAFLRQRLPSDFPLALADDDVPLVYPMFTPDDNMRRHLIQGQIFVPAYWPGVVNSNDFNTRVLPLPIDQRYERKDMEQIELTVKEYNR